MAKVVRLLQKKFFFILHNTRNNMHGSGDLQDISNNNNNNTPDTGSAQHYTREDEVRALQECITVEQELDLYTRKHYNYTPPIETLRVCNNCLEKILVLQAHARTRYMCCNAMCTCTHTLYACTHTELVQTFSF